MTRKITSSLAASSQIALMMALAALAFFAAAEWRQTAAATQSGQSGNITISGKVYQGEAGDRTNPLAGHPVLLTADDKQLATQTSDDGSFSFTEVELPTGYPVKLSVETCEGCQAAVPQTLGGAIKPMAEREAELTFQNCGANEECFYPVVEFFVTLPEDKARFAFTRELTVAEEKNRIIEKPTSIIDRIPPIGPIGPIGPVLEIPPAPPASVVDVTAETGQFMTGALTSWQTPDGPYNVEHLAGRNTANDLITLYWSPRNGRWLAVNITQATGYKITGAVTSWQTRDGSYLVEHLAGRALNGDLIVFYWSPASGGWRAVNVTQKTGQKIANTVTSWQTPNGSLNVEHLAGVNAFGQLIAFWWSPAHDWQAVNISAKTGVLVNSQAADWQVRGSNGLLTEYLAATNSSNQLFVFSWSPAHDWQAVNVTSQTGQSIVGNVSSWMTGTVQHLAGQNTSGNLLTFWRSTSTNWNVVNITRIHGENVTGEPCVYQMADATENVEILGSKNAQGQLIVSWWKPSRDWQAMNLTEITGHNIASVPTGWVTPNKVEHMAATTSASRLLVFYGFTKPRLLTDAVSRQLYDMKRMRNVRRNVLTILWDPQRAGHVAPSREEMVARIHGATDSIRGYFLENSNGYFTIQNAGVLGWYASDKPGDHYWDNPNGDDARTDNDSPQYHQDTYHDGWLSGHAEKWAEAIRKAGNEFNFAAYDTNGDDIVTPDELAILIAIPQAGPFGTNRGVVGIQLPSSQPLIVDGVKIPIMAEWYTGTPINFPVAAHELSHLVLGQGDLYFDRFFNPAAAGEYSLMDQSYQRSHMDPVAKLKHGWVRPKLIFRSGRYSMQDVVTGDGVWILMDPARGADEYFIVENRWRGTSQYERHIEDQGLAVWRVTEKQALIDILPAPPGVSAANWAATAGGRRAIQLLRPFTSQANAFGAIQLWDSSVGYELSSSDADPTHTTLRWANGAASGFALRSLTAEGAVMQATITVP